MTLNFNLPPEKDFALRTHQQSAQSLSREDAIDLLCETMRQLALKDHIVAQLVKKEIGGESN
jgi:hypothetical protein